MAGVIWPTSRPVSAAPQPSPVNQYDRTQRAGELESEGAGPHANLGTGSAYVNPNETVYYVDAQGNTHKVVRDSRSQTVLSDIISARPGGAGGPGLSGLSGGSGRSTAM